MGNKPGLHVDENGVFDTPGGPVVSLDEKGEEPSDPLERFPANAEVGNMLKSVPVLGSLSDEELSQLGGAFLEKTWGHGKYIFREGEEGNHFYIIKEGEAIVYRLNKDHNRQEELARLKAGDYFGEKALLSNAPRGASVMAAGRCVCFYLDRSKFHALFGEKLRHKVRFAKRSAISAETGRFKTSHAPKGAVRHKTAEVRQLILHALQANIIFKSIDRHQQQQIADEMWRRDIKSGETIIRQGEPGDNFYVVEEGEFHVFVAKGGPPKKVATRKAGQSFGELALMYNAPRAATVTAFTDAVVWCVDRFSFRRILARISRDKLREYERFLRSVPALAPLAGYERAKISEALEEAEYRKGQTIVQQGEPGDTFFLVKQGEVVVTRKEEGSDEERTVARYKPGEYFGERALIKGEPRAATCTAVTDVVLVYLDRQAFTLLLGPLEDILHDRVRNYDSANEDHASTLREMTKKLQEEERKKQEEREKKRKAAAEKRVAEAPLSLSGSPPPSGSRLLSESSLSLIDDDEDNAEPEVFVAAPVMDGASAAQAQEYRQLSNVCLEDFDVIGTLGRGSFGHVQLVKHRQNEHTYALKSVSKAQVVATGQQEHIISEKKTMSELDHPFVIRLCGTFKDKDWLYFVLEPSLGGELFSVLRNRMYFDEDTARFFAACVVLAFEYMHSKNIIYRDLKPENLLLDSRGYLKITDFGFAKKVKTRTFTLCGTPDYLAPEVVSGQGHGKGVDWWTLGILIYEMLASYPPFFDEDPMKTYAKIVKGKIAFPKHFKPEAIDLIRGLLHPKVTKRLGVIRGGADNIRKHPWFKDFDWDALIHGKMAAPIQPKVKDQYDLSNFEEYPDEPMDFGHYEDDGSAWDAEF